LFAVEHIAWISSYIYRRIIRKIIGHFKHSRINTIELQNCIDSPLFRLQQDIPTRWNSIFEMLQSLLRTRDALMVYFSTVGKHYKCPRLSDSDWEKM